MALCHIIHNSDEAVDKSRPDDLKRPLTEIGFEVTEAINQGRML
jgi:hypothetical protein